MDKQQAQDYFKQSDELYQQGHYAEALNLLESLNRQYPNQKNILHPMALALSKLGRNDEALMICDQVITLFDAPKAHELKTSLLQAQGGIAGVDMINQVGLGELDAALDRPALAPPPVAIKPDRPWLKYSLIAGGVIILILLIALPFIFGDPAAVERAQEEPRAEYVLHPAAVYVIGFLIGFTLNFVLTYFVLGIMGKHKYDTASENCIDIIQLVFVLELVSMIPLLGFFIALKILSSQYDMGCMELIIFAVLRFVVIAFIMAAVFGALLGGAMMGGALAT